MKKIRVYISLGLLCTLEIILTRFVQIPVTLFGTFTDRISLGFLPIMLAGAFFGPVAGGLAGGISDVIRASVFPQGPFNPLFTISAILRGIIYGLILHEKTDSGRTHTMAQPAADYEGASAQDSRDFAKIKKMTFPRILLASFIIFVLINNLLTDYLISVSYGNPFTAILITRIPTTAFNFIVQLVVGSLVGLPLERKLGYVRKW